MEIPDACRSQTLRPAAHRVRQPGRADERHRQVEGGSAGGSLAVEFVLDGPADPGAEGAVVGVGSFADGVEGVFGEADGDDLGELPAPTPPRASGSRVSLVSGSGVWRAASATPLG